MLAITALLERNRTRPARIGPGEFCFLGLGIACFVSVMLLWSHYHEPIGLGCGGGVKILSCAATIIPEYNQVLGVPWALIGTAAAVVAVLLAVVPAGRRHLLRWLLMGMVPLGFLRANEITLIGGVCGLCWLVLLAWVLAVVFAPGYPAGRRRAVWAAGLFLAGLTAGLAATPLYPDLDAKAAETLQSAGWRVIDQRHGPADAKPAGQDGLVIFIRDGCPYCHAYVSRTLGPWAGPKGTVVMLPRKPQPAHAAGAVGDPKRFPTTRVVRAGKVVAERSGFLLARQLKDWAARHEPPPDDGDRLAAKGQPFTASPASAELRLDAPPDDEGLFCEACMAGAR